MLCEEEYQEGVRNNEQAQSIKAALTQATRNLELLSDAGIQIGMGTDSGVRGNPGRWQGYFEHVEMEMMVEAGAPHSISPQVQRQGWSACRHLHSCTRSGRHP